LATECQTQTSKELRATRALRRREIPVSLPVGRASGASGEALPRRLPRPILWLAFASWVVCCGMLFITLVQREPAGGQDGTSAAEPLLVATVSAALETVFGDPDGAARAGSRRKGTASPPSGYRE
jgi:hypothetical protein